MFRVYLLIGIVFFVSGCSPLLTELRQSEAPQDQAAFARTIDAFGKSHKVSLLKQFQQNYPDSPWARRAETIVLYALEVERRKEQLNKKREDIDWSNRELEVYKEKNRLLAQEIETTKVENEQLKEQIEQLKVLLIQLEQRPK